MSVVLDRSALAKALAGVPKRKQPRICEVCGQQIMGTKRRRYCGRSCGWQAEKAALKRKAAVTGHPEGSAA